MLRWLLRSIFKSLSRESVLCAPTHKFAHHDVRWSFLHHCKPLTSFQDYPQKFCHTVLTRLNQPYISVLNVPCIAVLTRPKVSTGLV